MNCLLKPGSCEDSHYWLSECNHPMLSRYIFVHTRFTSQFIPPLALHVTPVTRTPAAWLNLLKKMWSEVSPAWFHWSSEVLWKGKLTTVHLQNLLVPACWAAWAGDNLEAARVSGNLWRQAFLGFFLLLLGLLFSGFCSDQMWFWKRKPTRKQKPK